MKDLPVIVQRVARSVVGVRAGRTMGCAFAAIGNGVLVTSQQVVGFERATRWTMTGRSFIRR